MAWQMNDTIVALASAPGSAERGIVRLSGPEVRSVLSQLFEPDDAARWERAARAERHSGTWRLAIEVPWDDAPFQQPLRIEMAVALWPTGRSYTGQPLAELHLIGSPPLLEAIITQLCRHGCRAARPGEFTLRAFLAGRLDLMQAEAVLGVIDAADHHELETALRQLAGGISTEIATLRSDLLDLLADLEAGLDFVDEDIEFVSRNELQTRVVAAQETLHQLLQQSQGRLSNSSRPKVVLAGLPNAGKSTLFNALIGSDSALVSEIRGTTRDYLSAPLNRDGLHIELIDTAGWDSSVNGIDAIAQQMRHEQFQQADLIVWCCECSADATDESLWHSLRSEHHAALRVATKSDVGHVSSPKPFDAMVSAHHGRGLTELCQAIRQALGTNTRGQRQWLGMTAARCQESLLAARDALDRTLAAIAANVDDDLVVIELRESLEHLGHIVGAVYTDDVLDRIFSKFCIGK